MIKAKYIGKEPYKAREFHASPGNTVFMSNTQWRELGKDQELFKVLQKDRKRFPKPVTRMPGWREELEVKGKKEVNK